MRQVSTLTALLQPGGPSGVTLAQRVDYLEAEVADLRSWLASAVHVSMVVSMVVSMEAGMRWACH